MTEMCIGCDWWVQIPGQDYKCHRNHAVCSDGSLREEPTERAEGQSVGVGIGASAKTVSESILDTAKKLVHGDRGKDYGHPRDDFERIAAIWSVRIGKVLTPEDVAWCMIAVKMSRLCTSPHHRDSMVDIAGYAETMAMCVEEESHE